MPAFWQHSRLQEEPCPSWSCFCLRKWIFSSKLLPTQIQEKKLDNQIEQTEGKLEELEKDHKDLKDTSAEKLAQLRGDCGELQRRCDDLEVRG
mgnify:CR=1 FL=1